MVSRAKLPYLFISIIFLGSFIYFLYSSFYNYKKFQILQNSYHTISSIYNNDNLIKYIDKEIILSSRYLGSGGNIGGGELNIAREQTIYKSKFLLKKDPDFKSELEYIRQKVDVLSQNSQNEVLKLYEALKNRLYSSSVEDIDRLSFIDQVKDRLSRFKELMFKKRDIVSLDGFIVYVLSKNSYLNSLELKTLDESLSISKVYPPDIKEQIINKAIINKSNLSFNKYQKLMDSSLEKLEKEKKDIFLSIQRDFSSMVMVPNNILYRAIFALLFLILFILFFRKFIYIAREEKKILRFKSNKKPDAKIGKDSLKTPKIDIANSDKEFADVVLKNQIKTDDKIKDESEDNSSLTLRGFDPLKKFSNVAKILLVELDKKDITFKYNIDKNIPNFAVTNVSKIDKILNIIVEHIIKNCEHQDNLVEYNAQIVAQTKEQIAIMLRFYLQFESLEIDSLSLKKVTKHIEAEYSQSASEDGDKEFFVTFNLSK